MSLQECLASRKDCSGEGRQLPLSMITEICKSTHQSAPLKSLFVVLPDGKDYTGGIYKYNSEGLNLITDAAKTKFTMELYPELISKEPIENEELIRVGLTWQYLSLKVESLGLGVSQRARSPKKFNKLVNTLTNQNHVFLYSVAVRERDRGALVEDQLEPLRKEGEEDTFLLETPLCYRDRAIYKKQYKGVPLDTAIINQNDKKTPNPKSLHEISQLLWACQGENDHATHGNRDALEKNGYGRVHASGCAGYSVYPIVIVDDLADISKGCYIYNPVGYSALNRWVRVGKELNYDHFIRKYASENSKADIERELSLGFSNYAILLCVDRRKPCSGFMHSKIMNVSYWAEIEAGMALAGLRLQANALGLKWKDQIFINPDKPEYRALLKLDSAEEIIKKTAVGIVNLSKNERFSLKTHLVPIAIFYLE